MRYQEGKTGRVFVLRFDNEEDFLAELRKFVKEKKIRHATVQFLGALKTGGIVVGPNKLVPPHDPIKKEFSDGRETIGFGTVFWDKEEPKLHIHGSYARDKDIFVGCLRENSHVFLIIEAIITEITGINVPRSFDKKIGLNLIEP